MGALAFSDTRLHFKKWVAGKLRELRKSDLDRTPVSETVKMRASCSLCWLSPIGVLQPVLDQ